MHKAPSDVDITGNSVIGGNVFSGMRGVRRLTIKNNIFPSVVRFFPYDLEALVFRGNYADTITCQARGDDYPLTIENEISENRINCDCRLNWLWLEWNETRAAEMIASGFLCKRPEGFKQFFTNASSARGIDSPFDGLVAVNYCDDTPSATPTAVATVRPELKTVAMKFSMQNMFLVKRI